LESSKGCLWCSFISWVSKLLQKVSSGLLKDDCSLNQLNQNRQALGVDRGICQEAFEKIKHALINAPVLATPELGMPFEMVSDASGVQLAAVLLQDGHPIYSF
jgi:hypothetical protein